MYYENLSIVRVLFVVIVFIGRLLFVGIICIRMCV